MASGFHFAFFLCVTGALWSQSMTLAGADDLGCPSGWTEYGSRAFCLITFRTIVAVAEKICIDYGGNLASIHSSGEQHFIQELIFKQFHYHAYTWIGLNDAIQEGYWFWTDGSRNDYTHWGGGEPNNLGEEHCTVIDFKGYWHDIPCHHSKPFLCAKNLSIYDVTSIMKP